jgi:hypothetical protein
MAKFKPAAKRKNRPGGPPQSTVSCVILLVAGILVFMLFLFFILKNANG